MHHLNKRVITAMLLAASIAAQARVTQHELLCLAPIGGWLSPQVDQQLRALAQRISVTTTSNGPPLVIATILAWKAPGVKPLATAALAKSVVHRLRAHGLELGPHEHVDAPSGNSPKDFGCKAHEMALEVEAIFWHPIYR